jgi:polysaccharide transporter, PST family
MKFFSIGDRINLKDENRRLFSNIFSLGILQGVNYILPLITVPYLVRVLGPDYFGLLAFSTATISYFMLITDYGFNLSATRQISILRNNLDKLNEIFSSVMMIKTAFMIISFILMSLLVFSFERFSENWELYFVTFGMVLGQVLFPVWLFQGMERMKYITFLSVGAKVFFTVCIFIFVREQGDYLIVPLLTALGFIVSGLLSLYLAKKEFGVSFRWQPIQNIRFQLVDGWHVFFSSIAVSLYTISTTFILGLFTNNIAVGYFAAADKIVQAVKGLYSPVSQAIYPLISKKIHENKQVGLVFIQKVTRIIGTGMFMISLLLFMLAEQISDLILGVQYQQSIPLLKIMAFLPFIISISNLFAVQGLYNLGKAALVSKFIGLIAILHLIIVTFSIYQFGTTGAVFGMLITEVIVSIVSIFYFRKQIINED